MVVLRWIFKVDIIGKGCVVGELMHVYDVSLKKVQNPPSHYLCGGCVCYI